MGLYVWTSALKKAYLWAWDYEYSYTFKWKTASQIGSERTTQIWTIAVNTNGLTWTSGSDVVITKSIPSLTNAKKIIVTSTIVGQSVINTAWNTGIGKWTWWGTGNVIYHVYWSNFNGMKVANYYNWTDYHWNNVWNATGTTYKPTLTIDLVAKTITWEVSWFSNSTLTLTDAQVTDIKTYEFITCYASLTLSTISDVSIKIEY